MFDFVQDIGCLLIGINVALGTALNNGVVFLSGFISRKMSDVLNGVLGAIDADRLELITAGYQQRGMLSELELMSPCCST